MKFFIAAAMFGVLIIAGVFYFDMNEETKWGISVGVCVLLFMGVILTLSFKGMFQNMNKTIRINKTGELIQATVMSIKQTNSFDGPDPEVIMDVRIHEADGSTYRAIIRGSLKLVELAAYQPGKKIEVVRDWEDREQVVFKHRFFKELQEKHRKDMAKKQAKQEKKMAGQVK
ncbi:MAG: hypothetical protein GX143_13285 [Alcaligenaceae bacterium]|jgi:hypothetical protein|nr:hypothetical protein [Alcaligenaceae bacterium]